MIIQKIHLKNWQKHSDLLLDFQKDINIISGYSNVGKSSIRRAIDWICFNANISETDYRREGTSETSVKIWLDNEFIIKRVRSNTINRYILSKNGCEDKTFDSFGREIPEEVQSALGISEIEIENDKLNLNIAEQLTLPFLLDKPATLRAKLFNKLTGNELIDKLFKEFNRENLRINREIKEIEENLVTQEEQLSEYSTTHKALRKKLNNANEQYSKLKEDIEIYEHLQDLSNKLKENKEQEEIIKNKVSQIKIISDEKLKVLKKKAEDLKKLKELSYVLDVSNDALEEIITEKKKIKIIKVDWKNLKEKNNTLNQLYPIKEQLFNNIEQQQKITKHLVESKKMLGDSEKELKELWAKQKACPLCKQEIKK